MYFTMASSSPLVALLIGSSMIHVGAAGSCKSSSMTNVGAKSRKTSALLQMVTSNGSTEEGGRALLSKRAMMSTDPDMSLTYTEGNCILMPYGDEKGKYVHFSKVKGWGNRMCKTPGVPTYAGTSWQDCVAKCSENLDKTWKVVSYTPSKCHCSRTLDTCTNQGSPGGFVYKYSGNSLTTEQFEAVNRRRRSCSWDNECGATSADPTCGNECDEFATAGTCCETCDTSSDSRRRDGRRRKGGYMCQRRRG